MSYQAAQIVLAVICLAIAKAQQTTWVRLLRGGLSWMTGTRFLVMVSVLLFASAASAEESGRIKRKPPTAREAERIASDMAMSDSLLQKGDIVATDRGLFVYRGLAPDGMTPDFEPISGRKK
jgi:hypothetical protein